MTHTIYCHVTFIPDTQNSMSYVYTYKTIWTLPLQAPMSKKAFLAGDFWLLTWWTWNGSSSNCKDWIVIFKFDVHNSYFNFMKLRWIKFKLLRLNCYFSLTCTILIFIKPQCLNVCLLTQISWFLTYLLK